MSTVASSSTASSSSSTDLDPPAHIAYTIERIFFGCLSSILLLLYITQLLVYRFTPRRRWNTLKLQLIALLSIALVFLILRNFDPNGAFRIWSLPTLHAYSQQITSIMLHAGVIILLGSFRSLSVLMQKPESLLVRVGFIGASTMYHVVAIIVSIWLGVTWSLTMSGFDIYRILMFRGISYDIASLLVIISAWYPLFRLQGLMKEYIAQLEQQERKTNERIRGAMMGVPKKPQIQQQQLQQGLTTITPSQVKQILILPTPTSNNTTLAIPRSNSPGLIIPPTKTMTPPVAVPTIVAPAVIQTPSSNSSPPSPSRTSSMNGDDLTRHLHLPQQQSSPSMPHFSRLLSSPSPPLLSSPATAASSSSHLLHLDPPPISTLDLTQTSFMAALTSGSPQQLQQKQLMHHLQQQQSNNQLLHPNQQQLLSPHSPNQPPKRLSTSLITINSAATRMSDLRHARQKLGFIVIFFTAVALISIATTFIHFDKFRKKEYDREDIGMYDRTHFPLGRSLAPVLHYITFAVVFWFAWCSPNGVVWRNKDLPFWKTLWKGVEDENRQKRIMQPHVHQHGHHAHNEPRGSRILLAAATKQQPLPLRSPTNRVGDLSSLMNLPLISLSPLRATTIVPQLVPSSSAATTPTRSSIKASGEEDNADPEFMSPAAAVATAAAIASSQH